MRERKSRYLIAIKNENRSPATIAKNLIESNDFHYFLKLKLSLLKTISY